MNSNCKICKVLEQPNPGRIYSGEYWEIILAFDQGYLGRCFVTLKQHKGSLSELSAEEWQEFISLNKRYEEAVKKAFGAKLSNWTCLMNDAFKTEPYQPHVHWHCRPRYDEPVILNDVAFTDPDFGHHYDRQHKQMVDPEIIKEIAEKIRISL
jgi:diadenosine tetraphosphate (Ap4A) HIT family hydrolase